METVPSMFQVFNSDLGFVDHKMWQLLRSPIVMTRMVFQRCTNLGDARISIGDNKMCQEFSSTVREARHLPTPSTANEKSNEEQFNDSMNSVPLVGALLLDGRFLCYQHLIQCTDINWCH